MAVCPASVGQAVSRFTGETIEPPSTGEKAKARGEDREDHPQDELGHRGHHDREKARGEDRS